MACSLSLPDHPAPQGCSQGRELLFLWFLRVPQEPITRRTHKQEHPQSKGERPGDEALLLPSLLL